MNGEKCQRPLQTIITHHLDVINRQINKTAHQIKAIHSNILSLILQPNLYQLDKNTLLLGKFNTVTSKAKTDPKIAVAQFEPPRSSTGGHWILRANAKKYTFLKNVIFIIEHMRHRHKIIFDLNGVVNNMNNLKISQLCSSLVKNKLVNVTLLEWFLVNHTDEFLNAYLTYLRTNNNNTYKLLSEYLSYINENIPKYILTNQQGFLFTFFPQY